MIPRHNDLFVESLQAAFSVVWFGTLKQLKIKVQRNVQLGNLYLLPFVLPCCSTRMRIRADHDKQDIRYITHSSNED